MALNDISLTAGMRSNLLALQSTTTLLDRTQSRLATGKKVNTALDNPTNFFAAQNHTTRASDLSSRKDGMSEAIQGVTAADKGITGITALIEAARGLTQSARSATAADRENLAAQFNLVRVQIDQLAGDSGYKGKNFLNSESLNVLFNENGGSYLTISGFNASSTGLLITEVTLNGYTGVTTTTGAAALTGSGTTVITTTGTSLTVAGSITGIANIVTVVHTAKLASSLGSIVATSTVFNGATSTYTGAAVSGATVTVNFSGLTTGGATFAASGVSIKAVYINGVALTGADLTIVVDSYSGAASGVSGSVSAHLLTGLSIAATAFITGASISVSFDLEINQHLTDGSQVTPNLVFFDLKTGDVITGLAITGGAGAGVSGAIPSGTSTSGLHVYVDGTYAASGSYSIIGSQIVFTGSAVPPSGTITYTYNTGLVDGFRSQDTVTVVTGGTTGLQIFLSGSSTALTGGQYTLTGNLLTLKGITGIGSTTVTFGFTSGLSGTTGVTTVAVTGTGTATSSTATYQTGFEISETLATGQTIINVVINGVTGVSGTEYVTSGNQINLASGLGSGLLITYDIQAYSGLVAGQWSTDTGIAASVSGLDAALATLRTQSASLASNLNVVATRQDFTVGMINTLLKGADNLTLADMNEEGANMLMLQTRQQLSTTSLKMASDAAQAVLRLF